ncbi:hypothetical protein FB385_2131 [Paramicrobacterium agarici]|uniref:Uncharacterized protein n=2 Tax=Paramicrobacterium agarici TaxID=630514 RepID=A0A2A9DVV8_9MICO|nr:hypothetical protein ATJ78_1203 [Microbacterium agarici]TQO23282.1 hypothetical protein FB385_2131 [Microbacterium agarici]
MNNGPAPQHPHPGYGQPMRFAAPGYPGGQHPIPYRPVSRSRPALTRSQKTAALWAGAIGFPIMSLGLAIVITLLGWSAVIGLLTAVASQLDDTSADAARMLTEMDMIWSDYWWIFALVLLAGLVVWAIGYGASIGIAKIGNVNKAAGATWAGFGIASCAGFVLMWLGNIVYLMGAAVVAMLSSDGFGGASLIFNIVFVVLGIVVWAGAGALSWWWMAHCLRARHPAQRYASEPYYV